MANTDLANLDPLLGWLGGSCGWVKPLSGRDGHSRCRQRSSEIVGGSKGFIGCSCRGRETDVPQMETALAARVAVLSEGYPQFFTS